MAITAADWVIAAATIAGPILAVRAQKIVEGLTDARRRKLHIFRVLMATRAARLSVDHVQALNMIDIEFSGSRVLGIFRYQSPKEKALVDAWRSYLDSLTRLPPDATEEDKKRWSEKTLSNFIDLLLALTKALGFDFDKVQLEKGIYSPQAHNDTELAQLQIRDSLVNILSGKQSLPMAVTQFPFSERAFNLQTEVNGALLSTLKGDTPLKVSLNGQSVTKASEE
jgi:hypothetical protein